MSYSLKCRERKHKSIEDYRSPFARDYDKVVHHPAFRRLQGKTQVVTPGQADFFRTRLTHTIEVAQIGRRLAAALGLDPDVVEAAAIIHDIGHPPFGHVGEKALCEAVDRTAQELGVMTTPQQEADGRQAIDLVGGFEGNAQSFRIVTAARSHQAIGLDLTRAVLDGAVKYPWARGDGLDPDKWCFYPCDTDYAVWVRKGVPAGRQHAKSLEAQVMDWADDVAYAIHDVEDWYKAGRIPLALLRADPGERKRFLDEVVRHWALPGTKPSGDDALGHAHAGVPYTPSEIEARFEWLFFGDDDDPAAPFASISTMYDGSVRAKAGVALMRKVLFDRFLDTTSEAPKVALARGQGKTARHQNDLVLDRDVRLENDLIRRFLWVYVIGEPAMATQQAGQRRVVDGLVDIFAKSAENARNLGIFPPDQRELIRALHDMGDQNSLAMLVRLVADHVAGMTDPYAFRLYARLTGVTPSLFNDFI